MYWFQLPTLELVINTSLYIVLVHYTVEATSIKHGVWNQRILCQDVLLVFPLFSRSNFQGIVHLNAKLMNSCLDLPFVKLVLRIHIKLDTNPTQATFLWLSTNHCSNVPTYRKKKKLLKFDVIHFGLTWWTTKMHQTFYFCPGLNANVTKYLPHRTFYPCFHFGSIGYYWKKNKDKYVFFRT